MFYGLEELGAWFSHARGLARIKKVNKEPLKHWPSYIPQLWRIARDRGTGAVAAWRDGYEGGRTQAELAYGLGVHSFFP